jgi:hypothetical protein
MLRSIELCTYTFCQLISYNDIHFVTHFFVHLCGYLLDKNNPYARSLIIKTLPMGMISNKLYGSPHINNLYDYY